MKSAEVTVVLETALGTIEIAIDPLKAPASAHGFLTLVDNGSYTRYGVIDRAVRRDDNDHGHPGIDVIQMNLMGYPGPLTMIDHEPTSSTTLRHLDGTVSLARGPIGTATAAGFFICLGDQPCLDAGGARDPFGDRQGFAAFGRVTRGMETVRAIHGLPTSPCAADPYLIRQLLDPPVRFLQAYRRPSRPCARSSSPTYS